MMFIPNGIVSLSRMPDSDGRYSENTRVIILVSRTQGDEKITWGGVDSVDREVFGKVDLNADRYVTVVIRPLVFEPTATPAPTPTGPPVSTATPVLTPNSKPIVTVIESIIARNSTWKSSFQYAVVGDLQIAVGSALTIEAGTTVKFTNATMFVFGTLNAVGTLEEPIVFTSDTGWRGIKFLNPFNNSVIVNGVIEKVTGAALDIDRGLLSVSDSTVRLSTQGIRVRSNGTNIVANEIYSNDIGVFSDRENSFDLLGNTIRNNVVGISLAGPQGSLRFNGNNIRDNVDANLEVTGMGEYTVDASNNWWGTAEATLVEGTIRHKFDDASLALVVYEPMATEPILGVR